jgi:Macrocin-O-methyltransferase (TylF)
MPSRRDKADIRSPKLRNSYRIEAVPPLTGPVKQLARALLRRLPISDYYKTRLWAASFPRPVGRMAERPYYRSVELSMRALANGYGGLTFPEAKGYSMLEFGVANGDTLQLMLHFRDVWQRRLQLPKKIEVLGFDTFEGLPAPRGGDVGLYYREGDYASSQEEVQAHLARLFANFRLVKGLFGETLRLEREFLIENPPIFIAIDCDYYSSTMDIFEALLPQIVPHGCMFYFDDVMVNSWSTMTGELRAIKEVNAGRFGSEIELVEYPLALETGELRHYKQLYRLFNLSTADEQGRLQRSRVPELAPRRPNVSPL